MTRVTLLAYGRITNINEPHADDRWGPMFTTLNLRWVINLKQREMRSKRSIAKPLPYCLQKLVNWLRH
jgi:hypothetical protein